MPLAVRRTQRVPLPTAASLLTWTKRDTCASKDADQATATCNAAIQTRATARNGSAQARWPFRTSCVSGWLRLLCERGW
jgi:hypothetical protein